MSVIIIALIVYSLGCILSFICISNIYSKSDKYKYNPEACAVYFLGTALSWMTVIGYAYIKCIEYSEKHYENI